MTNRVNATIAEERLIWGVQTGYRNTMAQVCLSDTLLIYARQELVDDEVRPPMVMGAYEVVSSVFDDFTPIFTAPPSNINEVFPIRVQLRPLPDISEPVPFKPLIPGLSFIKKKEIYASYLQGAMRKIPEEDYQRIIDGIG
jgi:predicted RNA-binding protein